MKKAKQLIKKAYDKLYKISTSKTAFSFIMFALTVIQVFCFDDHWLDNGIVKEIKEIESIIE